VNRVPIRIQVNGERHELEVRPWERLADVLRDRLGLTGTKVGCGEGECGACTVILDGKAVLSCLMTAVQADGRKIRTIEGMARNGTLHPLQESFVRQSAIQCGFCTPGTIMAAEALLKRNPSPSEEEVRKGLSNNLCRCTGYERQVKAVLEAARVMREEEHG
jgi:carbon-monoxide dehydrogenase small subunit